MSRIGTVDDGFNPLNRIDHRYVAGRMNVGSTIRELIARHAETRPDSPFLLSTDDREATSFRMLYDLTLGLTRHLRSLGVRSTDRVVTAVPNGPESAAGFLAVASASACAPLNPAFSKDQFGYYVDDLAPSAVVLQEGDHSPLRDVAEERHIPIVDIRRTAVAGGFGFAGDKIPTATGPITWPSEDDVALVLHTSGTTGQPKLVPIPHSNLLASAHNIADRLALSGADRALNIMPLFHIHGLVGVLLSSLVAGSEVVCSTGLDTQAFPQWLIKLRPSWYSGVPTMHNAILSALASDRDPNKANLRFVRSSSASLPVQTLNQLESTFRVPVIEAYGMTEASHQMTTNPLPPGERKPGSVGRPAGPDVAILLPDGSHAASGERGEVIIRGPSVINAYGGGRSPESFVDGWFRTGDLGFLDEDGYLFLSGRIKEMINRGGEKVAPPAVEEVLLGHPAVAEVAVFGIPHPTLGEDVAAAVVARPGHDLTTGDIRAFALERLADADVPGQIVAVDAIPKGPTAKVQRSQLHEQLSDRLQRGYSAPEGRIAKMLVTIWKEVLTEVEPGARDNFFALGGDSLSGARVAARVSYVFQIDFDIRALFVDPVLEGMAARIETALRSKINSQRT